MALARQFVKIVFFVLVYLVTGNYAAAILKPSVVCALQPSTSFVFTFTCVTDTGALLWLQSWAQGTSQIPPYRHSSRVNESRSLGFFTTRLDSVEGNILTSTATTNSSLLQNITTTTTITLICDDTGDGISNVTATLIIVNGPPPAPAVNPITVADEGSINSTLLISWSQSSCAVQYVFTIINSSDDRVYPNITTSNTNTTVTLPTGVEFCVTLVAVDSIGRKGPDTTPVCYQSTTQLFTILTTASPSTKEFSPSPTVTLNPIVTQSPGMVGGVNVAAAVAIPVVLVISIVVVVVVIVAVFLYKRQPESSDLNLRSSEKLSDNVDSINFLRPSNGYKSGGGENDDNEAIQFCDFEDYLDEEKDEQKKKEQEKENEEEKDRLAAADIDLMSIT